MKITAIIVLLSCVVFTLFFNVNSFSNKKNTTSLSRQNAIININVNNQTSGIKIADDFLGLSYEITTLSDTVLFKQNHTKFLNLINNLGGGVMRLNGYYTNFVRWGNHKRTLMMTKGSASYLTDSVATSDLDTLFSFMRRTKWKVILGVNFAKAT